jgi:Periplasmic binding protein
MPYYAERPVTSTLDEAPVTHRARRLALIVAIALLAAGPTSAAEPIRIGFMSPLSGIFAQAGKDMLDGLKMGLEAAGGQVAGRELELIEEDTDPANLAYNNPTQNVYILKVEKVGGRRQNTVIHTYPMVSQFWT